MKKHIELTTNFRYFYKENEIREGHEGLNRISIFFMLIIGYIEVYYSILYIFHYFKIFLNNLKNRFKKKECFAYFWDIVDKSLSIPFLPTQFPLVLKIR